MKRNLGQLLLAIFLIVFGISSLGLVVIAPIVTGSLALAAGILLLLGK